MRDMRDSKSFKPIFLFKIYTTRRNITKTYGYIEKMLMWRRKKFKVR